MVLWLPRPCGQHWSHRRHVSAVRTCAPCRLHSAFKWLLSWGHGDIGPLLEEICFLHLSMKFAHMSKSDAHMGPAENYASCLMQSIFVDYSFIIISRNIIPLISEGCDWQSLSFLILLIYFHLQMGRVPIPRLPWLPVRVWTWCLQELEWMGSPAPPDPGHPACAWHDDSSARLLWHDSVKPGGRRTPTSHHVPVLPL